MCSVYYASVEIFQKDLQNRAFQQNKIFHQDKILRQNEMLEDTELWNQLFMKVNVQRRSKILRCKNKEDKMRSLLAGLLLRYALEQEGIAYESVEIQTGSLGKPYMAGREDIYFSLSHSGKYAVCAISNQKIGVDMENSSRGVFETGREKQLQRIVERICTLEEKQYLESISPDTVSSDDFSYSHLSSDDFSRSNLTYGKLFSNDFFIEERNRAFLQIWTRKESYGKADGRGLSSDFTKENVLTGQNYVSQWIGDYCLSIYSEGIQSRNLKIQQLDIAKQFLK